MADAHAEGLHDEIKRDGCPECDRRPLSAYPAGQYDTTRERQRNA